MPSPLAIVAIIGALFGFAAVGEGFVIKKAWQDTAAEKQALAQAAQSLKDLHDAEAQRTGVETGCSGKSVDDIIASLHSGTPCDKR